MQNNKLKLIFILILAAFIFSSSKEVKEPAEEPKSVEAKVETVQHNEVKSDSSVKTELPPKETQAKEEKAETKEVIPETPGKKAEKEGLKYLSDEKHYMAKGSLLFYNLNINDTYEQALAKLKDFGVNGLYSTAMMPKSLQEMGCKAYIPDNKTLEEDASNDFYIIFKDGKIIRFIKFFAYNLGFYKFYRPDVKNIYPEIWELEVSSGKGYTYFETPDHYTEENNVIYRNEIYYPTEATTIIMTRDGYKTYFEEADRRSDDILELGDLYFYDLHIKDDMETIKTKLFNNYIIYKGAGFSPVSDLYYSVYKDNPDGFESRDEEVSVWWYKDKIIHLRVPPSDEDTYILMHHFQRKYKVFEGPGYTGTCYGTRMGRYKYNVWVRKGKDFMFTMEDETAYIENKLWRLKYKK
ncbi:hypothetical protein E4O00_12495 [Treponema sp. OMZ 788]|uniref:hypothetical protein n=1 Tax=Treponema sp. OMZ 788 TaxID=2563664 RepID=UPI0020A53E8A|nr:hypothetical protein [Treponema sp. OMZ 788]UTC65825.1 hypothetical protein E4O00_12495 [Treponema sp. OMZ 788]